MGERLAVGKPKFLMHSMSSLIPKKGADHRVGEKGGDHVRSPSSRQKPSHGEYRGSIVRHNHKSTRLFRSRLPTKSDRSLSEAKQRGKRWADSHFSPCDEEGLNLSLIAMGTFEWYCGVGVKG